MITTETVINESEPNEFEVIITMEVECTAENPIDPARQQILASLHRLKDTINWLNRREMKSGYLRSSFEFDHAMPNGNIKATLTFKF
jgi:hypothetical protein